MRMRVIRLVRGGEGEGEDGDVVFLAEALSRVGDGLGRLEGDALRAVEAEHPCSDPTFGVDPHPFRPSHPTPATVLSKDANAVH